MAARETFVVVAAFASMVGRADQVQPVGIVSKDLCSLASSWLEEGKVQVATGICSR